MINSNKKYGFTLIELMVAVIIIAVLAAVAVPQYKKAVLKSRFSKVMPVAKAVASGEEIFFLNQGDYTSNIAALDVTFPEDDDKVNVAVSNSTQRDNGFDYVLASHGDAPGVAYIIYQERSEQFPGTVMCEANNKLNPQATWLCKEGLGGRPVSNGSLQGDDWEAYLLVGEQGNSKFTACSGPKPNPRTSSTQAVGTPVCDEETGEYTYSWSGGREYGVNQSCSTVNCQGGIFSGQQSSCVTSTKNGCEGGIFSGLNAKCSTVVSEGCAGVTLQGNGTYCEDRIGSEGLGCKGVTIPAGSYCTPSGDGWSKSYPGCVGAIYEYDPNDSTKRGCCISYNNWHCPVGSPVCDSRGAWNGKCWGEGQTKVECED